MKHGTVTRNSRVTSMAEFKRKFTDQNQNRVSRVKTLNDPYGIQATANRLDPQKCREQVEKQFKQIRQDAGSKRKHRKTMRNINQEVLNDLVKLYGRK